MSSKEKIYADVQIYSAKGGGREREVRSGGGRERGGVSSGGGRERGGGEEWRREGDRDTERGEE